jgi:hypothetical protein
VADNPVQDELKLHMQRTAQLGALTLLVKAIVKRSENRAQIADLFRNMGRDCVDEIRRGGPANFQRSRRRISSSDSSTARRPLIKEAILSRPLPARGKVADPTTEFDPVLLQRLGQVVVHWSYVERLVAICLCGPLKVKRNR